MTPPETTPCPLTELNPRPELRHLAIGVFDGVHLGHQSVIARMRGAAPSAREAGVLTFEPHPLEVIAPERAPRRLSTPRQRERSLLELGVAEVVTIAFDEATRRLSAREFVEALHRAFPRLSAITIGLNWVFGYDRQGDAAFLERVGRERGFGVEEVPSFVQDGAVVSSTRIRQLIGSGELDLAARLLGRPYELEGRVVHGEHRGRRIGFRTANLGEIRQLIPPHGVYACLARFDVHVLPAVVNIGIRPTFEDQGHLQVEAHLLDYEGDLYDRRIELTRLALIRGERPFENMAELKAQIEKDVAAARALLET